MSFIAMVDIHSRLESADDIVAEMIAAETRPVMKVGANLLVTAIIAVEPETPGRASLTARAARPRRVGNIAIAAMRTPESREALKAVFSSLADSKRLIISGPDRKVQK